jgi:predicted ester cyclase
MKRSAFTLGGLAVLLAGSGLFLPAQARKGGSTTANKEMVRRLFDEVFNQGKIDQADQYITADAVDHQAPPGLPQGVAGFKTMVTNMRAAFPDLHVAIEDMIAEGDKVVVRSTLHGTQTGELRMGPGNPIPATGKAVTIGGIDIIRFAGGKMVEHWGNEDDLGMMQQLGLIPAGPPAAAATP